MIIIKPLHKFLVLTLLMGLLWLLFVRNSFSDTEPTAMQFDLAYSPVLPPQEQVRSLEKTQETANLLTGRDKATLLRVGEAKGGGTTDVMKQFEETTFYQRCGFLGW